MRTEKELEKHVRGQEHCLVQPQLVHWVPRAKVEVLKNRKKACQGQSEEERWKYVYGILFPEDPSLPSPCKFPTFLFRDRRLRSVLKASLDYDDLEQRSAENSPASPTSHNLAAFQQYSQENLPRRVREAFEAILDEQFLPIEESLKRALPEVVRKCQAQMFREWERLSSGVAQDTEEERSTQNPETDGAAVQGTNDGPMLREPISWNESLSKFYIEPESAPIDSSFDTIMQSGENGERPSRTMTDSGYHSLHRNSDTFHPKPPESLPPIAAADMTNAYSFQEELEGLGAADIGFPSDFDWGEFLSDHVDS
jgi:hypothetical protein